MASVPDLPEPKPTQPDTQTRFDRILNLCAQFFPEFLIIVRFSSDRPLCWKSSDRTWAVGAAKRYLDSVEESDRIETQFQDLPTEPENGEETQP